MAKKTSFLAVAVLATGVLAACNADNNGSRFGNQDYANDTRPIGYYSNDRDLGLNNVNYDNNDNGEGPITDMMDNDRNDRNNRNNNLTNNNGTTNMGNYNNGTARYADGYDGRLADRIEKRVEKVKNVDDARVIVTDDTVLVGIDTNDNNNQVVESDVRNAVQKLTNKNVRIVTDENTFNRMGNITNDLRNGKAYDEVKSDVTGIMNDLGDAIQRPFQNNR